MTNHIDEQVAEFRRQLETATSIDPAIVASEVLDLASELMTCSSHDAAATAMREFFDAHADAPDYARAVLVGALVHFSTALLLVAPITDLPGPDGLLRRMQRLQADQALDLVFGKISRGNAADAAEKLGISLDTVADAAFGQADALKELSLYIRAADGDQQALQQVMDESGLSYYDAVNYVDLLVTGMRTQADSATEAGRKQRQANKATDEGTAATKTATEAYMASAGAVDELEKNLSDLIDEIMSANEANLDTREANRRLIESLSEFDTALAENGATLDLNTEKGRENEANLDAIAQAAMDAAKSTTDAGGSYEEYRASLESSRQAILNRINDLGVTGQAAEDLADEILQIPTKSEWEMIAKTEEAATRIQRIQNAINGLKDKTIQITVNRPDGAALSDRQIANQFGFGSADGNLIESYANGGITEHHVAQLARAGAYRVWAEAETGGEAYIPLAPAKRGRSTAILGEVANQFGFMLVPSSAAAYANGSPLPVSASGGAAGLDALADRIVAALMARPSLTIQNPVVRDLNREAWEAAQMIGNG